MKSMGYEGKSTWDLFEEAVMLLRSAPLRTWFGYYLGSLPFVGGLIFFLQLMTLSARGHQYLTWGAFWLMLSYIWMKVWHTYFAQALLAQRLGQPLAERTRAYWLGIARFHAAHQWWSTLLFVWGFITAIPFGWANAYCQSLTIFAGMDGVAHPRREALSVTFSKQRQNHLISVVLRLFGLFVVFNLLSGAYLIPQLMKTLLGMDTQLSIAGLHLFNTSFVTICVCVAFLLVDPLMKATYLLCVFYHRSRHSGEDLLGMSQAIRQKVRRKAGFLSALLLCVAAGLGPWQSRALGQTEPTQVVDPEALGQQIEKVMSQSEYVWRMPPAEDAASGTGFFHQLSQGIVDSVRQIGKLIRDFFDWVERQLSDQADAGKSNNSVGLPYDTILLGLGIAIALFLGYLLIRNMRKKPKTATADESVAPAALDLESETVVATDLPEDQWLVLAREYVEKGDLRLALRAYYLSLLVMLENKALIKVTRAKSNLDYLGEVARRRHAFPGLVKAFQSNIQLFERSWYGLYAVGHEELQTFQQQRERIGHALGE